ncbi:MAG: RNA 2',3'-cyclic phosphodiesterase [Acidimicrobiales bacterium]
MDRLFVAVWPPAEVLDEICGLPRPVDAGVRWTRREHLHVTLRFLGAVDDARVGELTDSLSDVSAEATIARLGPAVRRLGARVAMIPVAGVDELADVVGSATAAFGDRRRPFVGHLTVARARRAVPDCVLGARMHAEFEVGRIALVRSRLTSDGPRYEDVVGVTLALHG